MAYTPNEWSCGQTVTAEKLNNIERGVAEVNSEYVPTTWQCGDVITAEKMNKIEQGIANAGGGDSWTVLTEESVTTEASEGVASVNLSYSQLIDADTIRVTFNGTVYECERQEVGLAWGYGATVTDDGFDFSEYPFNIQSIAMEAIGGGTTIDNSLFTETAGTYTIKIEAPQSGGSSDFSTAEVTIVNAGAFGNVLGYMPICHEAGELGPEAPALIESTFGIEPGATEVFVVPIYKNGMLDAAFWDSVNIISVTGEAEWESPDTDVYITGDCTITAQAPQA